MRRALVSFVIALAVWLLYTWPLALHVGEAIPSSSHNIELGQIREMVTGDQLQLLYHFWLFSDMMRGETPWFHNLYEFNTGEDAARYYPSPYFVPFSLAFSLFSLLGRRALAWNLTGLLSIGLTLWLTWWVVRRFVEDEAAALCASLVSITMTFRWVMLLGGSPSGFAMTLVPFTLGGVHLALRERSAWGGWVAGLGLLFTAWSDVQTFYFLLLFLPAWCLICAVEAPSWTWSRAATYLRALWTLLPVPLLVAVALALRRHFERFLEGALLQTGRSLQEVAGFSPRWQGFLDWTKTGLHNHVFLGYVLTALLGIGFLCLLLCRKPGTWPVRSRVAFALILACMGGILLLALGTQGPFEGLALRIARRVVPRYHLVRLPARIFVLMPTLLAVAVGCTFRLLDECGWLRRRRLAGLVGAGLLLVAEGRVQVEATLCVLHTEQGAYAAVAREAEARGEAPRALIVPLWPGDSDLAATYQHYASLYRIRMLNGYSPVVSSNYFEKVFRSLESVNQGWLIDEQIEDLRGRGIHHLLLHEDLFPEKVSPFPVQMTLHRFLTHPRLTLLEQDGPVWAFRMEAPGVPASDPLPAGPEPLYLPTRWLEAERIPDRQGEVRSDPEAGQGMYLAMAAGDALSTRPLRVAPDPRLAWNLRVRGTGEVHITAWLHDEPIAEGMVLVSSADWRWVEWPFLLPGFGPVTIQMTLATGSVDVDAMYLGSAGPLLDVAEPSVEWPAHGFFHAGHSDARTGAVYLRAARDPDGEILYATVPWLPPGRYRAELRYGSDAPPGTLLGFWRVSLSGGLAEEAPVRAGEPGAGLSFQVEQELPVRLAFRYLRNADLHVNSVTLSEESESSSIQSERSAWP